MNAGLTSCVHRRFLLQFFTTMAAPTVGTGTQTWSDASNVSSTSVPVPTDLASGERWFAAIASDPTGQTYTYPGGGGWTEEWNDQSIQSSFSFGLAHKIAGASESAASVTLGTAERSAGVSFRVLGAASNIHSKGTDANGSSSTAQIPEITTTVNDCLVIGAIFTDVSAGDTAPTTPSGWTQVGIKYQVSGALVAVYQRAQATPDTISATNVTLAVSEQWAGVVFALEPSGSGTAHDLTANVVIASTTSTPVMSVTRSLAASVSVASNTPNALLAVNRPLAASAAIASTTPDAALAINRPLTGNVAIDSTTSTPAINVDRSLTAAVAIVSLTSDIRFAGQINFEVLAAIASTTSTPVLKIDRSIAADAAIVSQTPDVVLLNGLAFSANVAIASTTGNAALHVDRPFGATVLMESVTSAPVLVVNRTLLASVVVQSSTPDVLLTVDRLLVASVLINSTTSTPVLSIPIAPGVAAIFWVAKVPGIKWSPING